MALIEEGGRIDHGRLAWTLTEGVHEAFMKQREKVRASCSDAEFYEKYEKLFAQCKHIVVYGYSQQVIDLLEGYFKGKPKTPPLLHVLECRTKTIYSSSGRLLYLDGHRYAKALSERLKDATKITLEPDVALGRLIHPPFHAPTEDRETALILLGSNAVYPDGTFVHSMGHTSVAAIAKTPGLRTPCYVAVVTDGMKIGRVPEKEEETERNPHRWLTHNRDIVEDLTARGIELHNWREDRVPSNLIDYLIVLDAQSVLQRDDHGTEEGPFRGLKEMEFDARKQYSQDLEQRILASIVSHSREHRQDLNEVLAGKYPRAPEHERDWYIAGEFLRGNLTQGLTEPHAADNLRELANWLAEIWGHEQKKAAEDLAAIICHSAGPS